MILREYKLGLGACNHLYALKTIKTYLVRMKISLSPCSWKKAKFLPPFVPSITSFWSITIFAWLPSWCLEPVSESLVIQSWKDDQEYQCTLSFGYYWWNPLVALISSSLLRTAYLARPVWMPFWYLYYEWDYYLDILWNNWLESKKKTGGIVFSKYR